MTQTLSVLQMAQWAVNQQHGLAKHTEHSLEKAAKLLQAGARKTLGHYQPGNAQFQTWPELADETKDRRGAWHYPENEPLLVTGELHDHILYEVELTGLASGVAVVGVPSVMVGIPQSKNPHEKERDIGEVALAQEMGTHTIPARSFLGLTAARLAPLIAQAIGAGYVAELVGDPQQAGVGPLVLDTIRP